MSGPRPTHLYRRGAVYCVRFRLPSDVSRSVRVQEVRKSLHTKDLAVARRRCLAAATWFQTLMERLRLMPSPTRSDLENAARLFFANLQMEVDARRLDRTRPDLDADERSAQGDERIQALDAQLIANDFDVWVRRNAAAMCQGAALDTDHMDEASKQIARSLAARAERAKWEYLAHQLAAPATVFVSADALWGEKPVAVLPPSATTAAALSAETVESASQAYLERKRIENLGDSHITELERSLGWLKEHVGGTTPLAVVQPEQMREVRDGIERIDVRLRGRPASFHQRQTNAIEHRIKSVTAQRYWKSLQAFFEWAVDERLIASSPAAGYKIAKRKGEGRRSPEALSADELKALFATPLFQGHQSPSRRKQPGTITRRGAHWWSFVILIHTGMRAGELAQLYPADFVFDAAVPHIKVRETDDQGETVKTVKNQASVRDVPILPDLLTLGLRQFVEGQGKRYPKDRIFREFRTGTNKRKSDGLTKFWRDYLSEFGLWKPGRATHVNRHTVIAVLRANGVSDEDIASVVGHSSNTMTSRYGGNAKPLDRKLVTLGRLSFGFDVIGALGGPYDAGRHA